MTQLEIVTHTPINPDLHAKNLRILGRIQERAGGVVRLSKAGVPHLVCKGYSVVRFGNRKLRVFSDYTATEQTRIDFNQWPHVAEFLKGA